MTGFKLLREKIIKKINDSIADGSLKTIAGAYWTYADVQGMPAIIVMPEALESSYENTAGGRHRTFIFRLYIIKNVEGETQTQVDKDLSLAVDDLIEMFDKKNALSVADLIHIRPVPSVWDWIEIGTGEARCATFTLNCDVIVSTT